MRRRFSIRKGLIAPRDAIQLDELDDRLRARLWSSIVRLFFSQMGQSISSSGGFTRFVIHDFQDDFLGEPIDEIPDYIPDIQKRMKSILMEGNWGSCYDLVQFFCDFAKIKDSGEPYSTLRLHGAAFIRLANDVLEAEKSGYRIVSGELTDIVDTEEVAEIEKASARNGRYSGSAEHIRTALTMYSDRENPDYRNSIKEAISAVESCLCEFNGERSNSLPDGLRKATGRGLDLHPAMQKGVSSIYGWTSDEHGIRHALSDEGANVGPSEARLMIILCSAFVNYIKSRA